MFETPVKHERSNSGTNEDNISEFLKTSNDVLSDDNKSEKLEEKVKLLSSDSDDSEEQSSICYKPIVDIAQGAEESVENVKSTVEFVDCTEKPQSPPVVEESTADRNDCSVSDLLLSVIKSYRDAMVDQKILLINQANAINRLAVAIEEQTKIMRMY